jgi:hypothetical protein
LTRLSADCQRTHEVDRPLARTGFVSVALQPTISGFNVVVGAKSA